MNKLSNLIKEFTDIHQAERNSNYSKTANSTIITYEIPKLLTSWSYQDYIIKWSVWQWQWSEIPWIALLDEQVTSSTRDWYYIVVLFDKSLQSLYFALWVWWTQFKEEFWTKEWKAKVREYCEYYAKRLEANNWYDWWELELGAESNLWKWYETCQIITKEYFINELNDNIIFENLNYLNKLFNELKLLVWSSILNDPIDTEEKDINFSKLISKQSLELDTKWSLEQLVSLASKEKPKLKEVYLKKVVRNRKYANYVKERVNYICEFCWRLPFIQKNWKPYAEADHIEQISTLSYWVDHPDNMRCLCAQCHVVITYWNKNALEDLV